MQNIFERENKSYFQVYKRFPIEVDYAKGCKVYCKNGKIYLDFLAGIAVNALGHSHPKIIDAVCNQAQKYMHISNYIYQEAQVKMAEKLKEMSGLDRVFLSNSGTEATEAAIKLARKYGFDNGKTEIIGFTGGFHGRTYGALSLMDKPQYKDKMGPFLSGMKVIKYNDISELENNLNENCAAVILEFIQGEGGIDMVSQEFVNKLAELREKFNFLIIADEIQSGAGRTGKFVAYQNYNILPDIVTMAKGIGGGLPLGAMLAKEKLANLWGKGTHGTTYGGNAVACASGLVVLEELESGLMKNVIEQGNYLKEKLFELKDKYKNKVLEVRGTGLMLGLLLNFDASILVQELLNNYVISNAASGKVLRIIPPLIINKDEIDEFISILDKCLKTI